MSFEDRLIGVCSRCGGGVRLPAVWLGTVPPTPTCEACGAVAGPWDRPALPVIQTFPVQPPTTKWPSLDPGDSFTTDRIVLRADLVDPARCPYCGNPKSSASCQISHA